MLAVSLVTFVLVSVSPIDPVQANVGQTAYINMSEAKRAQLAEYWGVNTPLWERYANWFVDLLHGDLGTSLRFNAPVIDVIATRAVNSLALMATAWAVSGVLGFALGILAGANRGRLIDRIVKGYCFLLASVPTFWLGLLFLIVFSVQLGWFPFGFSVPIGVSAADVTFADALHHLALPALTLSVIGVANIALHTREKTIDVLESDYVRFARARGLSTWGALRHHGLRNLALPALTLQSLPALTLSVVGVANIALHTREKTIDVLESDYVRFARARGLSTWGALRHHGLRNLALPALTLQFASISEIFGGSVLVEQVFSYPGLGQAAVTAGLGGDAALLVGIALFSAAFVFTGNLIASTLYGVVDPRMRKGAAHG